MIEGWEYRCDDEREKEEDSQDNDKVRRQFVKDSGSDVGDTGGVAVEG